MALREATMTPAEALASAIESAIEEGGSDIAEHRAWLGDHILAALAAAGFVVVPKVATEEMLAVMEPYAPDGHHCFEAIIRLLAARPR